MSPETREFPRLWTGEAVLEHALEVAGIPMTGPLREEIRRRGRRGGLRDTLAAMPLVITDPVRARLEGKHDDAHHELQRLAALDRIALTARRARNRLRQLRALMAFLNRTDHHHADGVPCRAEREALVHPVVAELEKLTKRAQQPRRERKPPLPTTKETVMATSLYNPGGVVEGPYEEPTQPPATLEATFADFPPVLRPYVAHFEMKFAGPPLSAVLTHEALRLADVLLDLPAAERAPALARLLFRLAVRRSAR
jgi:hypothetical protein